MKPCEWMAIYKRIESGMRRWMIWLRG